MENGILNVCLSSFSPKEWKYWKIEFPRFLIIMIPPALDRMEKLNAQWCLAFLLGNIDLSMCFGLTPGPGDTNIVWNVDIGGLSIYIYIYIYAQPPKIYLSNYFCLSGPGVSPKHMDKSMFPRRKPKTHGEFNFSILSKAGGIIRSKNIENSFSIVPISCERMRTNNLENSIFQLFQFLGIDWRQKHREFNFQLFPFLGQNEHKQHR